MTHEQLHQMQAEHRAAYRQRYKPRPRVEDGMVKLASGSTWHQWLPKVERHMPAGTTEAQLVALYTASYKPADAVKQLANFDRSTTKLWADLAVWSQSTFGSDAVRGPIGALKHLRAEVAETIDAPDDLVEYADCLMLILDAARRAGFSHDQLLVAAFDKLAINRSRTWPSPVSDEPVMHVK